MAEALENFPVEKYSKEALQIALDVLKTEDRKQILSLMAIIGNETPELFRFKFEFFCYLFFGRYFTSKGADFHDVIIEHMRQSYYGNIRYLNLGFRGCAKTSYTKLFLTFMILNDQEKKRKYIKVMTRNMGNAKQMV